jgi:hypothetical protein
MTYDFSYVNLQYLMQARDLAVRDPELVATLLGIPVDMARLLAELNSRDLAHISHIKPPLLIPRPESWWWSRLLTAAREGRTEEIDAIMDHAPLITVP